MDKRGKNERTPPEVKKSKGYTSLQAQGTNVERRAWRVKAYSMGMDFGYFIRRAMEYAAENIDVVFPEDDQNTGTPRGES